jgi:hypothetical protein
MDSALDSYELKDIIIANILIISFGKAEKNNKN